jgi:glycosyltransferase involved in cell wall biosynthesis
MYHLVCLTMSVERRRAKAAEYENERPGLYAPGGFPTNAMYLPERFRRRPLVEVPAEDQANIRAMLEPAPVVVDGPPREVALATREVIDRSWAAQHEGVEVPERYQAEIALAESDLMMLAGVPRQLAVRLRNTSTYPWPGGVASRPSLLVGSQWIDATGAIVAEGPRRRFPATVPPGAETVVPCTVEPPATPGDYRLRIDVLHEFVRWFGAPLEVPVVVEGAAEVSAVSGQVVAAVWAHRDPESFLPALRSLRAAYPDLAVYAASADPDGLTTLAEAGAEPLPARSLADLVNRVREARDAHVLAIGDPVTVPGDFLSVALDLVAADPRVGTVSFLSNAAAFLSFPERDRPTIHQVGNADEVSLTRRLRADGADPVSIPWAAGGMVLLSATALSATGPVEQAPGDAPDLTFADFSMRARRRGFVDLLDPTTFVSRPSDIGAFRYEQDWSWLYARHPFAATLLEGENAAAESPLGIAITSARASALGLHVGIDGTTLGPKEMGTQVQTVCLIEALSAHDDVRAITVLLGGDWPLYARAALSHPKVRTTTSMDEVRTDVMHRPYQPDGSLPIGAWRAMGRRTMVTLQDVIAYQIGAYFHSTSHWLDYRRDLRAAVAAVDGVVAISRYTEQQVGIERLPVDADRMFVVENGTDHLSGDEPGVLPAELARRGFVAGQFALVIGANYSHKNRDLAIAAYAELRKRGLDLALVCVGALVPYGSSRLAEARLGELGPDVFILPDVSSEERNWLLRHAAVVLYPTGAEGFGLVPYEAARFGTPTVLVSFGPFTEVTGALPVSATSWAPDALADVAEQLLRDPATARAQVARAVAAGADYTWTKTADKLVAAYRALISRPARHTL